MITFKHPLHERSTSVMKGLYALAITLILLAGPAINPLQAAVDEAQPSNIPTEVISDWKDQDGVSSSYSAAIDKIKAAYPAIASQITGTDEAAYLKACHLRRIARMKPYMSDLENVLYMRHHPLGGFLVGYHDNSDAGTVDDRWTGKSAIARLSWASYYPTSNDILSKNLVMRDPCISFDGTKMLFAMSGTDRAGSGYKIYEISLDNPDELTQLTKAPEGISDVVSDFEPCYLPNGDIMFTSTRNFGLVDCAYNPTTNMFLMGPKGEYMHQVGFDQVNTFFPVIMDDGTVLYTRWEYNDRSLTNCMGLFVMNPDGSHQTEYFGNQTSWPYTQLHGRPIPGSDGEKVICVAGGHHGPYSGELMIIDRSLGSNGKQSVQMIAPRRETKPRISKNDISMGNIEFLFSHPYPLGDTTFLVSWRKTESESKFRMFFMDVTGGRELLASGGDLSGTQPVVAKARPVPFKIPDLSNYRDSVGTFVMNDVYFGGGMEGVDSLQAKSMRVVALHYRVSGSGQGFGSAIGQPPSGSFQPAISCPISTYGCSWEAKEVLGETPIYEDGSAAFIVPARTPVYFQVLDSNGFCLATMRSWATLMPGEKFACSGCHESKTAAVPIFGVAQAGEPKPLTKNLGIENERFEYTKFVQPILDAKCKSCHSSGSHTSGFNLSSTTERLGSRSVPASYVSLTKNISNGQTNNKAINVCTIFSEPEQRPAKSFGSTQSGIFKTGGMSGNHHDVQITDKERRIMACWIDLCAPATGRYNGLMSSGDSTKYANLEQKRVKWEAIEKENIKQLIQIKTGVVDYGTVKTARAATEQLNIRYVSAKRELVLNNITQGNLILVDLMGREVTRIQLSNEKTTGLVSMALPTTLSRGLYVARFEGVNGIQQAKISITH